MRFLTQPRTTDDNTQFTRIFCRSLKQSRIYAFAVIHTLDQPIVVVSVIVTIMRVRILRRSVFPQTPDSMPDPQLFRLPKNYGLGACRMHNLIVNRKSQTCRRGDRHEFGVGIIISKKKRNTLLEWHPVNKRIITGRFFSKVDCSAMLRAHKRCKRCE